MTSELARRAAGYETMVEQVRAATADVAELNAEAKEEGYHLSAFKLVARTSP